MSKKPDVDDISRLEAEAFANETVREPIPQERPEASIWNIPKRTKWIFTGVFILSTAVGHFLSWEQVPTEPVEVIRVIQLVGNTSAMTAFSVVAVVESTRLVCSSVAWAYRSVKRQFIARTIERYLKSQKERSPPPPPV